MTAQFKCLVSQGTDANRSSLILLCHHTRVPEDRH